MSDSRQGPELPPRLPCAERFLGPVTADPGSVHWHGSPSGCFFENVSGAMPEQQSTVQLAWDRRGLRVLLAAEDRHPWATLTRRKDPLYTEEVLEVFLDPTGDGACYFEIEVNPLNTVLDLVLRRNRSGWVKDFSWECDGLETAVRRLETGWVAELSIPFAALGALRPEPGGVWRANFCRIDRPEGRERELSAWAPTRCGTFHSPARFGFVEFC